LLVLNNFGGEATAQTPATRGGLVGGIQQQRKQPVTVFFFHFFHLFHLCSACPLRSLQKLPTAPLHQPHTRYSCRETSWSSRYVHPHAHREMAGSWRLGPHGAVSCMDVDPAGLCQAPGSGSADGAVSVSLFPALPPAPEHISDAGFPSERSWFLAAAAVDHGAPGQHWDVLWPLMGQQQTLPRHTGYQSSRCLCAEAVQSCRGSGIWSSQ